jgi:hypothetical protein
MPTAKAADFDYWRDTWAPMIRSRYAAGGWCVLNGQRLTVEAAVAHRKGNLELHRPGESVVFRGARTIAYLKTFKPSSYTHRPRINKSWAATL